MPESDHALSVHKHESTDLVRCTCGLYLFGAFRAFRARRHLRRVAKIEKSNAKLISVLSR